MSELKNRDDRQLVEEIQNQIYSNMSFAQKWERVCDLRTIAWNLKAARLRSQHADWSEFEVQGAVRKIFLYGST